MQARLCQQEASSQLALPSAVRAFCENQSKVFTSSGLSPSAPWLGRSVACPLPNDMNNLNICTLAQVGTWPS